MAGRAAAMNFCLSTSMNFTPWFFSIVARRLLAFSTCWLLPQYT
jgi:hypothetical protein